MLFNYLKIAIRNIGRQKFYAFINITGLTIGLITSFLIILYVVDEFSFDKFHKDASLIYRVNLMGRMSGQEFKTAYSSAPLAAGFTEEIPEIDNACRIAPWKDISIVNVEDSYTEKTVLLADSNFFDFFSFNLILGDPKSVLNKPYSIVLTETAANKIFGYSGPGDSKPIGKTLEFGTEKWTCTVTGIVKDPPLNSHFHFSMILSMGSWDYSKNSSWLGNSLLTYIKLHENADWKYVESKIPDLVIKNIGPQAQQYLGITLEEFLKQGGAYGFYLQPLLDIHFTPEPDLQLEPGGIMDTIYLLVGIVIFIIVIACINFMNLSTAKFSGRAKEVGVRKSLGGSVSRLRTQFLMESVMYTLISLIIAQIILAFILPQFNVLSGKLLTIKSLYNFYYLSFIILMVVIIGILAGSYPAFYLTSFKPVEVLRGRLKTGMKSKGIRRILVIFQFTMSIGLIICTLLIYKQLQYIQTKDLGFEKNNLIVIKNAESLGSYKNAFKEELLKIPEVVNASICNLVPPNVNYSDLFRPVGLDNKERGSNYCFADEDLIKTLKTSMVGGRFFSKEFPSDSKGVVINEAAARLFGWENPVGQKIQTFWKENNADEREVIGVVKDYNFQSLEEEITSLIIFPGTEGNNILVRLTPGDINRKINLAQSSWKSFPGKGPFDFSYITDDFSAKFRKEQQLCKIFIVFTILAIIIASLGLLGLATFTAEQRSKEIGIRKAMGASSNSVIGLISREYLNLIIISFIIAAPIAYFTINWWLKNFAYKASIGVLSFIIGGILALLIAVLSVGYQSLKAASRNPVDSLKFE
ncbi:MAG TPA: ABC transporter permease [Bacteroidales bacterium]|nr:ABC transporter permease [Bacteroidales bacterium]